ncbi:hypothetical protein A1D22_02035 [Pasteurellaceae bacterium LFhippo2]|nr:hypothetical protein [Pasteurellaceae bacterium LFhippo2]
MKTVKIGSIFSLLFISFCSQAHNVWLEKSTENQASSYYIVKFGHKETEAYSQHKLIRIQELVNGTTQIIKPHFKELENGKGEAEITVNGDIVFLEFDNGVWSKLPSGKYVEKTKKEAPSAEFSINPMKLGKAIIHWNKESTQPHNQAYELVPLDMPIAGKQLDILVLHNDKPVKDIKVGTGEDDPFVLSNDQGIAKFAVKAGINKVWAEFEEKVDNHPDYTDRSYEYILSFEAK